MKHFTLILFILFLAGCFINRPKIKVVSSDQIEKRRYTNCSSYSYYWKDGGKPINGIYKIEYSNKMAAIIRFNNGTKMETTSYYRRRKTDKVCYSQDYGEYKLVVYSKKSTYPFNFEAIYDSVASFYKNNYLQTVEYYKKDLKFNSKITYFSGWIKIESTTDDFLSSLALFDFNNTKCPYKYLMTDPLTGKSYEKIYVNVSSPSSYIRHYYKLKDGKYEYDRSEM